MAWDLSTLQERMHARLAFLYGAREAGAVWAAIAERVAAFRDRHPEWLEHAPGLHADHTDVLLITYGDQVRAPGEAPLRTLKAFMDAHLKDRFSGLHLLPHYPYSSDDGFSVIDYRRVNPELGTWADVEALARAYRLMLDAVINHVSAQSPWFQAYRRGEAPYVHYFIELDPSADTSTVYRPREHPLLTPFETARGTRYVWTTFSTDQVDLNYKNPAVLVEVLEVLLEYAARGADLLRLDAVGLIWKELGTSCLHLPQTHAVVKLIRDLFNATAPHVMLLPEINGPFEENLPYLGDGYDEAQMIYNFTLPPLVLHAFYTGEATRLARWLEGVRLPSDQTAFFNFLASHDGIGVRPVEPLLPPEEFQLLIERTLEHGGRVNYRRGPGGERQPYELCTTYYDALTAPDESLDTGVARFRAAHAILLALAGVPGVYVHSLFGTPNWHEGYARTRQGRTLNRRKFTRAELEAALAHPEGRFARVFHEITRLLEARRAEPAFHPTAPQRVLHLHPSVLALERTAPAGYRLYALANVSAHPVALTLEGVRSREVREVLTGARHLVRAGRIALRLEPYGVRWLRELGTL